MGRTLGCKGQLRVSAQRWDSETGSGNAEYVTQLEGEEVVGLEGQMESVEEGLECYAKELQTTWWAEAGFPKDRKIKNQQPT